MSAFRHTSTTIALVISVLVANAALAADVVEYRCGVTYASGEKFEFKLLSLAPGEKVVFPSVSEPQNQAVTCARSKLVPTVNDAQVLALGFRLFIGAPGRTDEEPRMALLVGQRPNIVLLPVNGTLTRDEDRIAKSVLRKLNGK